MERREPLIEKLVELDRALHGVRDIQWRWYDTPFEPWVPRMAFLALWSPPWCRAAGLLSLETWDNVREDLHNNVFVGDPDQIRPRVAESSGTPIARELKAMAERSNEWPAFVGADGSFFPHLTKPLPGEPLGRAPGVLQLVPRDLYGVRLAAHSFKTLGAQRRA